MLPPLDALLDAAVAYRVPLRVRFRGVDHREGLLVHGPAGWGEFAPFAEYGPREASRWLAAAIEAAWVGWPTPVRTRVPVNVVVPAVDAARARDLVVESSCSTAKVKVAEPGQSLDDDVTRVAAVRAALGPSGRLRVDANGAWPVAAAVDALRALGACGLEYVEHPGGTVAECAQLRRLVEVPVAVDEGLRKAADPLHVEQLREAADVLVLKVPPLGGVRPALQVAASYGLPCVVSSALDTSVGLAAGVALAAALPDLPYACGLGSALLLKNDVTASRCTPRGGVLEVGSVAPWQPLPPAVAVDADGLAAWRRRLRDAYLVLAAEEGAP